MPMQLYEPVLDFSEKRGISTGRLAPSLSADGRYVAFESDALQFEFWRRGSSSSGAWDDIFVRDLKTNSITLVSQDMEGDFGLGATSPRSVATGGL